MLLIGEQYTYFYAARANVFLCNYYPDIKSGILFRPRRCNTRYMYRYGNPNDCDMKIILLI